jgi:hypothetical protein
LGSLHIHALYKYYKTTKRLIINGNISAGFQGVSRPFGGMRGVLANFPHPAASGGASDKGPESILTIKNSNSESEYYND